MNKTRSLLQQLAAYESPNVTFQEPDGSWPIIWDRARGARVWDVEGRCYTDLTAAFGVAAAGHANPRVVAAARRQMGRLLHAMGDVHPHEPKVMLARELSRITFERWAAPGRNGSPPVAGKVVFGSSGFEAVEAALKTAFLATGRHRLIAFEGGYHGLGYGTLNATHRAHFWQPFRRQLADLASFVPFPTRRRQVRPALDMISELSVHGNVGAVLIEPIQARGGVRVPPPGFLGQLRRLCDERGMLLVADEIYTGFGRTGRWFACEHEGVVPDLICLGKALTGGFPLSACVGRADLMDRAWPVSQGEAIHTSTFLGHPVGCAMALAQIAEIRRRGLVARSARLGQTLLEALRAVRPGRGFRCEARGRGLMAGLEIVRRDGAPATERTLALMKTFLREGYIALPEGEHANVLSFTPPLTIAADRLRRAVTLLQEGLL